MKLLCQQVKYIFAEECNVIKIKDNGGMSDLM
jgi:hypothetical protein